MQGGMSEENEEGVEWRKIDEKPKDDAVDRVAKTIPIRTELLTDCNFPVEQNFLLAGR